MYIFNTRRFAHVRGYFVIMLFILLWLVATPIEAQNNPRVYRIEMRLTTADVARADTDPPDNIYVRLNNQNLTWIDHARDDFERSDVHLYDLMLMGISRLDDIQFFLISKMDAERQDLATDGWCIDRIELYVNRGLLFDRSWPGQECQWIDSNNGHPASYSVAQQDFDLSLPGGGPPRNTLDADNLQRLFESVIGNSIAEPTFYWGDDGSVSLSAPSGDTLRVIVHMKDTEGFPDPDVEMRFDLVISCRNDGDVRVVIKNNWRVEIGFAVGGPGIITDGDPWPLMEDARTYLRQVLNRRAGNGNCIHENMIVVTNGPEIRIVQ